MFKDFLNKNLPIKSQAKYVEFGYGQVEPNHLSAQRNAQIYAQLPANKDIEILENGQFVKYDYAANGNGIGEVNFTGEGEWMLVYNEIKLYRDHYDGSKQWDCEFAMIKDDYQVVFIVLMIGSIPRLNMVVVSGMVLMKRVKPIN